LDEPALTELRFEFRDATEFGRANRREVSWVAEQRNPEKRPKRLSPTKEKNLTARRQVDEKNRGSRNRARNKRTKSNDI
jgi:hypothetical protein